jgi:hypothetical protein
MDSEDEEGASPAPPILLRALSTDNETGSSDAEPLSLSEGSLESPTPTTPRREEKSKDREDDRTSMVKCIVNSVVESEGVYVECLTVMLQVRHFMSLNSQFYNHNTIHCFFFVVYESY